MTTQRMWLAAFIGYGLVLGGLSPTPATGTGVLWDKPLHLTAYLLLFLLGTPLLAPGERRSMAWLAAGVFAYGALLELGQHFVPGRDMSAGDLLANGLGVAAGWGLSILGLVRQRR